MDRPEPKFAYGDWVTPTSISNGDIKNMYWAWGDRDAALSHVGNYIKLVSRTWTRDYSFLPYNGYWRYRASNCWYHEDDLVSKEDYQATKKTNKKIFASLPIADLL